MNPADHNPNKPTPPARIAIPDGKGGYTYEEVEMFDLRKPRVLPGEDGWRGGIIATPDPDAVRSPSKKQP